MKRRILVRVDGHKRIGMGHLYRTLTLAKYLSAHYDFETIFAVRNNRGAINLLDRNGFRVHSLPFNISRKREMVAVREIIAMERPCVVIVDLLKAPHETSFMKSIMGPSAAKVVVFTDVHKKCDMDADIVINTSVMQRREMYLGIDRPSYYVGLEYVINPIDYLCVDTGRNKSRHQVEKLVICMGGVDHHNVSLAVLKAIDKSMHDFCCDVILSADYCQKDEIAELVNVLRHKVTIHYDLEGICDLLRQADLAVTGGGNTHVERMCAGVPGVVINQMTHQSVLSKEASQYGATVNLGMHSDVCERDILKAVDAMIEDRNRRDLMRDRGRELVDGKGLLRVSDIIVAACKKERTIVPA